MKGTKEILIRVYGQKNSSKILKSKMFEVRVSVASSYSDRMVTNLFFFLKKRYKFSCLSLLNLRNSIYIQEDLLALCKCINCFTKWILQ